MKTWTRWETILLILIAWWVLRTKMSHDTIAFAYFAGMFVIRELLLPENRKDYRE